MAIASSDCLMKLILQKKLSVKLACKGKLLGCSIGNILGIIVCTKWQSGPVRGNPTACGVIGNSSFGDGELPQGETLPDLKAQGLPEILPPLF